ncbi:hypothetical protein Patl1_05967 [Pistacia atlantica]|uniref:Uncharacterized protein n=1 Tax=Pistacia atlantica TaxID=434234 RepID=A0ACC1BQ23_9ROSI|nr:hypothetical protein Patl1_05967 [Pistacia atlantica]
MSGHSIPRSELTHHRLYEFAKTALIKIFSHPYVTVCDLYCGGGVDIEKWESAQIANYIGIDVSSSGISELKEAWESQRKNYNAEFFEADPCGCKLLSQRFSLCVYVCVVTLHPCVKYRVMENLETQLQEKAGQADLVCCLQHLQMCFETEERARRLLHNVSSLLKPGGYFLGITPDSSTIWAKYQKNVEAYHNKGGSMKPNIVPNCIRSESYMITFEVEEEKYVRNLDILLVYHLSSWIILVRLVCFLVESRFPLFGKKYQLKFASDISAETHCLVHFPKFDQFGWNRKAMLKLGMDASYGQTKLAREAGLEYVEIQNLNEFYDDNRALFVGMLMSSGPNLIDPRGRLLPRSYDVLGLYTTFIFQKPDPDVVPPLATPLLQDDGASILASCKSHNEREWPEVVVWRDDDQNSHAEPPIGLGKISEQKGILGPGPADLRFPEAL